MEKGKEKGHIVESRKSKRSFSVHNKQRRRPLKPVEQHNATWLILRVSEGRGGGRPFLGAHSFASQSQKVSLELRSADLLFVDSRMIHTFFLVCFFLFLFLLFFFFIFVCL